MPRWPQIESIFAEALQRPQTERDAYVRRACAGDAELLREVTSLLANHREDEPTEPWAAAAAQLLAAPSLEPGQQLGPYRIVSFLAAGGMGAVYRAHDPRTGRDVAIKVAAQQFSERFTREVRAVAALNHPNVCTLYDVGPDYLVMELVEGPTLADRIAEGALPWDEALAIAQQIANALEDAHEKQIVHRDLKPGNVKIAASGLVKVLDFGLAQVSQAASVAISQSPTFVPDATKAGMILGTAAYMAPEQARGTPVDKRADIWAFGVVLYEMLTGRPLFQAETMSDTIAAVLTKEPDWTAVPARARPLLRRCLERDAKKRLRDIGDALSLIDIAPEAVPGHRAAWMPWGIAAVLALALGAALWTQRSAPITETDGIDVFEIAASPGLAFSSPAVSPDGRRIVLIRRNPDSTSPGHLALRSLDSRDMREFPGADVFEGSQPFWSVDSRFVFFVSSNARLKKIDVRTGTTQVLTELSDPLVRSGSGNADGAIVYTSFRAGVMRVANEGASPIPAMDGVDRPSGFVSLLPDGQHFIFGGPPRAAMVGRLGGSAEEVKPLVGLPANVQRITYVPAASSGPGRLVFLRQDTLLAQKFDPRSLELSGDVSEVAARVSTFSASRDTLVYAASPAAPPNFELAFVDDAGNRSAIGEPDQYTTPVVRLSPDGTHVATMMLGSGEPGLFLLDLERGGRERVAAGPRYPAWSVDSRWIAYAVADEGKIYRRRVSPGGEPELLLQADPGAFNLVSSWSKDGRFLVGYAPSNGGDIFVASLDTRRVTLLLKSNDTEAEAQFSPDMKWIAYLKVASASQDVYAVRFSPGSRGQDPSVGEPVRVSPSSVSSRSVLRWSADGRALRYVNAAGALVAAELTGDADRPFGPEKVMRKDAAELGTVDVSLDGRRLLVRTRVGENAPQPSTLTVITNWQTRLP